MRKFDYSILKGRTWDNEILSYVSQIQEYKGEQELFTRFWQMQTNCGMKKRTIRSLL